jgi:hypothetical protein
MARLAMSEKNKSDVVCAFCGESLSAINAVEVRLMITSEETQTIYAHPAHLRQHLHSSIPLHPNIWEAAQQDPISS